MNSRSMTWLAAMLFGVALLGGVVLAQDGGGSTADAAGDGHEAAAGAAGDADVEANAGPGADAPETATPSDDGPSDDAPSGVAADEGADANEGADADAGDAGSGEDGGSAGSTGPKEGGRSFDSAVEVWESKLEAKYEELNALRERIREEKMPLIETRSKLERRRSGLRAEYRQKSETRDERTVGISRLRRRIKDLKDSVTYLSNLLGEYVRNFESRVHVSELQRYRDRIESARLAVENQKLEQGEVFARQYEVVDAAMKRVDELIGGVRFEGEAVASSDGTVKEGRFFLLGPSALFQSEDGSVVGSAEQRLGSTEPTVLPFSDPQDTAAAAALLRGEGGRFPLDPTLGKAHKIESTEDTLWEHVQKGGPVMVPIFVLAGLSLLVALYKWITLTLVPKPSRGWVRGLLNAVSRGDGAEVERASGRIKGPVGRMLGAGVAHIRHPRQLIEEVMYERVLESKLKLQRLLPFIAITAAAAPLLGLLGTVTGIINTFKLITVFGTGDVQTLSGGISEALVTTEFGLIVAIPSLLLHAFLSRKAKGIVNQMEKSAVAFVNEVEKSPFAGDQREAANHGAEPEARVTADVESAMANLEHKLSGDDRQAIGAAMERLNTSAVELLRAAYGATPPTDNNGSAENEEPGAAQASNAEAKEPPSN